MTATLEMLGYAAYARELYELGWLPIPVREKSHPPAGATGREGTVSEEKIIAWADDPRHRDDNVALRSDGTWIGIDVDAYGAKIGEQTLAQLEAELGELPVTISSTSRGPDQPSRIWFYRVPSGLSFVTKFADIEIIQHSHRYAMFVGSTHPITGEPYRAYGYEGELLEDLPAIDDLEDLPEAWLNRLTVPDVERGEGDGYAGGVQEWLQRVPDGTPGLFMQAKIDEIPQGDFGHDVMVSLEAAMVALAAKGETGVKPALTALRDAWLRGPYNTPDNERDYSISLESAIAKFGALPDRPEDILAQDQAAIAVKIRHADFIGLWISKPPVVTADSLRERVARIMSIAYDEGLTPLEAAALGWHSHAAQDPEHGIRKDGLEALWQLALDVAGNPVGDERQFSPDADQPKPVEPLMLPSRAVALLTQQEVARRQQITWWGDQFMARMREYNNPINEQYFHLSMWVILSLAFSQLGYFQKPNGAKIILNFYCMLLGPSNSGKSESFEVIRDFMKVWEFDDGWDLGGDATAAALTQALIRRYKIASDTGGSYTTLLHPDEADAMILNWNNQQGEFKGMKQRITDIFGGNVPKIQRATMADVSDVAAEGLLNIILTGVPHRVADAIDSDGWVTGFMNRFVWARGDRAEKTDDQLLPDYLDEGESIHANGIGPWIRTWIANFRDAVQALGEPGNVTLSPDVKKRSVVLQRKFSAMAANSVGHTEQLTATFERLHVTTNKCAALVAMVDGRRRVTMDDYIIALEQTEEWVENILIMVEATHESPRARQAEKMYDLISRNGGRMSQSAIASHDAYRGEFKTADALLRELIAQRRVEELDLRREGGEVNYRIVREDGK